MLTPTNNTIKEDLLSQIQRELAGSNGVLNNNLLAENTNSTLYLYCETVEGEKKTLSNFDGEIKNFIKIHRISNGLMNHLKINYSASVPGDQFIQTIPFSIEFFDNPIMLTFMNTFNLGKKLNLKIKRWDPMKEQDNWTLELNNVSIFKILWSLNGNSMGSIEGETSTLKVDNNYKFSFRQK
jgi:hypothetical protein